MFKINFSKLNQTEKLKTKVKQKSKNFKSKVFKFSKNLN